MANLGHFVAPLARTTITSDICRQLMAHILKGDWKPGDRLPAERDLCKRLGVGRTSLREALKALEILGLIEPRRGGGTYVTGGANILSKPFSWAIGSSMDLQEVYEARRAVEGEQALHAAERATPEDLAEIEAQVLLMDASTENPAGFYQADVDFHLAVGRAAHNRILINIGVLLSSQTREWLREAARVPGLPQSAQFHRRVLEAISAHDGERARALIWEHLDAARSGLYRSRGGH